MLTHPTMKLQVLFLHRKEDKKRRHNWNMVTTFNDKKAAVDSLKSEECWSFHFKNTTTEGVKHYYRCNQAKKRGVQCNAGLHLLSNSDSEVVTMYKTEEGHSHEHYNKTTQKLSDETKQEIKKLFDLKVKPKRMFQLLTEKGFVLKNYTQLSNYLVQLRKQTYGSSKISLGELEQWCSDHNKLPDSDDAAFVV